MAGAILLCCGVGPFATVTAIDIARDSSSDGADQSGDVAQGSRPSSSPQARSSQDPPPIVPSRVPPPDDEQTPPKAAAHALPSPQPPLALPPTQRQSPLPLVPVPPMQVTPPDASTSASPRVSPATSPPRQADGRIGESVRDGQLEFVVRSVQCGLKLIGTNPRSVRPQGQFCLAKISVHNIGDRPQTLFEMEQKAIGGNGTEYSSHSIASLIANEPGNTTWLSEIRPGGEVAGAIVYELPEGIDLARLELNDPTVPGGVAIALR